MDRVQRGLAATISMTFYAAGDPADPTPDSATIEVLRDDATVLVVAGTATTNAGAGSPGKFTFNLTPTETSQVDILTAQWTLTYQSVEQTVETFVEVVGGFACSIAQIDAFLNIGGAESAFANEAKAQARDAATDAFEAEIGYPLTPRYRRDTINGEGRDHLLVSSLRPTLLLSGTVDDTALTSTELTDVVPTTTGFYRTAGWAAGVGNISLAYEHGLRTPPGDCSRAVALIAASLLKDGPYDDRGYGVTDEGGAVRLLTAGVQGAAFSVPEVEAVVRRHRQPVVA